MMETLTVSLSGPALSLLLYENLKSKYSQEGFLIGEIIEKETKTITDNDQRQVHISRVIRINCSMPCPHPFYFYDGIGRVDTAKVKNYLGDLAPKVVAWYKYKPSFSFNFNFREKIIHAQLTQLFHLRPEFFSCCLLISESSDNNSTHSFTQTFVRYHNDTYERLPLHIVNLSDPNNMYKTPEQVSKPFLDILNTLKINHTKTHGINIITNIQNALKKHTEDLVDNLAEAEKRLFRLENEVIGFKGASNNKDSDVMETDSPQVSPVIRSPKEKSKRGRTSTPARGSRNSNELNKGVTTRSKTKS